MTEYRRERKDKFIKLMKFYKSKRNKYKRLKTRNEYLEKYYKIYDNYETLYDYDNLINSYFKCRKGVNWKGKVQKANINLVYELYKIHYDLAIKNTLNTPKYNKFIINERGKIRNVTSVSIQERIIQKNLYDLIMKPIIEPSLIYDNGASLKGKGIDFTRNRLTKHLVNYYKKYGDNGYILQIDFKSYFDSISHDMILNLMKKRITDIKVLNICKQILKKYSDEFGISIGSTLSQILALLGANPIDHYCKDRKQCKYYGRYMDDIYIIHKSKKFLKTLLNDIKYICKLLNLTLSPNKTKIIKLSNGFTFLKTKYKFTKTGKIIRKNGRESAKRMRHKLKKLVKKLPITYSEYVNEFKKIHNFYKSWRNNISNKFNSYKLLKNMDIYFNNLTNSKYNKDFIITCYSLNKNYLNILMNNSYKILDK